MARLNPASHQIKTNPSFKSFCNQEYKERFGLLKDQGLSFIWVVFENQKRQMIHEVPSNDLVILRHAQYRVPFLKGDDLSATCKRYFSSMVDLIGDLFDELPEGEAEMKGFGYWQPGSELQHALGIGDAFITIPNQRTWNQYRSTENQLEPGRRFHVPVVFENANIRLRESFIHTVLLPALRRKDWGFVEQRSV